MIPIPSDLQQKIEFLTASTEEIRDTPAPLFDAARLAFLADLSRAIMASPVCRELPDVVTFGFWCRKANLTALEERYDRAELRMGLGLVYHIAPANVPVNFAYSLAFGLLTGNSNVVRLSSTESAQAAALADVICETLSQPEHQDLAAAVHLIRYPADDEITAFWISHADGRLIWGGDQTIHHIRSFAGPTRSREIAFSDRYSICAIDAASILGSTDDILAKLCDNLHNDIYLMDQQACSSPQLVIWQGNPDSIASAKDRLWTTFEARVKDRYTIEPIQAMNKYVDLCDNLASNDQIESVVRYDNWLYRVTLDSLQAENQHLQRGYYGTVHEYSVTGLAEIADIITPGYQTLTYFGFDKDQLADFITSQRLRGIDRIVPIGKAVDMDIIWDGYDIPATLTRVIDIQ